MNNSDNLKRAIEICGLTGVKALQKEVDGEQYKTTPYLIFTGTIHADPGCPLYEDIRTGRFIEPTIGAHIDEEELFLKELEVDNCLYFGLHPSNVVRMQGWLSRDKDAMLEEVRRTREKLAHRLDERPARYGEGAIVL